MSVCACVCMWISIKIKQYAGYKHHFHESRNYQQ